jgi:hypothetical protein
MRPPMCRLGTENFGSNLQGQMPKPAPGQTQFLLRHVSVQTTERYRGCKQPIDGAVNDRIGIEP